MNWKIEWVRLYKHANFVLNREKDLVVFGPIEDVVGAQM